MGYFWGIAKGPGLGRMIESFGFLDDFGARRAKSEERRERRANP